jgi:hypothetical protein
MSEYNNRLDEEEDNEFNDDPSHMTLDKLEEYLELLYSQDDFVRKIKGSFFIMNLSRNKNNLEYMITNGVYE